MMVAGVFDMEGIDSIGPHEGALMILAEFDADPNLKKEIKSSQIPLGMMDLRMRFNGHRHPVMFAAEIEPELYQYLQDHRSMNDLLLLMKCSQKFGIRRSDRGAWSILQRLFPQLAKIEMGGETFEA